MDMPDASGTTPSGPEDVSPRVFISHSSRDEAAAMAVCRALESRGIRCWIAPRDIQPGANWAESILNAIGRCRVMVLLLSSSANASAQVLREVERAVNRSVAIIPVRIEEVMPAAGLEYFLSASHWLDAFAAPLEIHLRKIAGVVETSLGGKPPLPAPSVPPRTSARGWLAAAGMATALSAALWFWRSVSSSPPLSPQPVIVVPAPVTPPAVLPPRATVADFVGDWEMGGALLKDMMMNWTSYDPIRFSVSESGAVTGQAALVREDRGDEMILHRPPILVSLTGMLREASVVHGKSDPLPAVVEIELSFSDGTVGKGAAHSPGLLDITLTKGDASCRASALRK